MGGRLGERAPPYGAARREHPQQQVADPDLAIAYDSPYLHPGQAVQLARNYIIAAWMDAVPAAQVPPISAMPRLRDEIEFALAIVPAQHIGGCTQVDALLSMCLLQIVTHFNVWVLTTVILYWFNYSVSFLCCVHIKLTEPK
jgi:hypothetical protein